MPTLDEIADRIADHVTKYMGLLAIDGERPIVKLRSNLGSKWLGRSTWSTKRPHTTLLEIQQSVLGDDRTLERVIAHEMIHHRDALGLAAGDLALLKVGIKPEAHGVAFREGAARVNAIMGPGFVTEVSDKEYAHAPSAKQFFVLITPLPGGKLGWTWAASLGAAAQPWIDELLSRGSRLARTTDERWTRGARIKRHGGYSIPRDPHDAALLQQLYETA